MKELKCRKCGHWNASGEEQCQECGAVLPEDKYQALPDDPRHHAMKLPLWELKDDDHPVKRGTKHVVRFGQLIFFTIISFIAAMASSTVH